MTMRGILLCCVVLFQLFAAQIDAQRSTSPWQTLNGESPLVIARGGFSGIYPDSSLAAYRLATQKSLAGVVQWCDVQLTQDEVGICLAYLDLSFASDIKNPYPKSNKTYTVNGVPTNGWFTIDFFLKDLTDVSLYQAIQSRSPIFNANGYKILTIQDVATEMKKPQGLWLNVQNDAFYAQHNLNISRVLLSISKTFNISFISSPEVNFFEKIAGRFGHNGPIFVFQFLEKVDIEPTTNQTYGSILSNLTFVKTFASGILVPKSYIFPVDDTQYLLPHTSLVQDAHKAGLQVYVSGFANDDVTIAYNYSYDSVSEYLSFVDNGDFSVDGVLSDFPITASASIDCFSHIDITATKQVDFLVMSKDGASAYYPGCSDLAYEKAIKDGADVIDCSVQMSSDGIPFCLSSIDLKNNTMVAQTPFIKRTISVPEISPVGGIYSFSLTWPEIRNLTPAILNPFSQSYNILRNPKDHNSGKLILLSEFLTLAKNSASLSGVLISVEYAAYLREKQGLDVIKAVLDTLTETGYSNETTAMKVLIQSTDSSVLVEFKKQSKYETVYKIEKFIGDILDSAIEDIKKFATAVVIHKLSVFPTNDGFLTRLTNVVHKLHKYELQVYVEVFRNEFVNIANDFFSDATVQINSYISEASINGTISDFPFTAARYKRNKCLGFKEIPPYMSVVKPGGLLSVANPVALPPAQPPNMAFTDDDVSEPALPPVIAKAPTPTLGNPSPGTPSTNAQAPSGQTRLTLSLILSVFCMSSTFLINLLISSPLCL